MSERNGVTQERGEVGIEVGRGKKELTSFVVMITVHVGCERRINRHDEGCTILLYTIDAI